MGFCGGHVHHHQHQKRIIPKEAKNNPFARFILGSRFETFGGMVVLFNFGIITAETHCNAVNDTTLDTFITVSNTMLLFYYLFEVFGRMYVLGKVFFSSSWNNFDLCIALIGIVIEILDYSGAGVRKGSFISPSQLKLLKMMRLLRLVRLVVAFPELYKLVAGIGRSISTLRWAGLLIFLCCNFWSVLSVTFLQDLVDEVVEADDGSYSTCTWCPEAFMGMWRANLTWFQVTSGDGWGELMRPFIERHFWAFLIIASNIFIVTWGLLNLIVAAIVDSAVQAREADAAGGAAMARAEQARAHHLFASLLVDMGLEENGDVTLEDFMQVYENNQALRDELTLMGVKESSIGHLLVLLDSDGNGLDTEEFLGQFTDMRTHVMKTSVFYTLKYVEVINETVREHSKMLEEIRERLVLLTGDSYAARQKSRSTKAQRNTAAAAAAPGAVPPSQAPASAFPAPPTALPPLLAACAAAAAAAQPLVEEKATSVNSKVESLCQELLDRIDNQVLKSLEDINVRAQQCDVLPAIARAVAPLQVEQLSRPPADGSTWAQHGASPGVTDVFNAKSYREPSGAANSNRSYCASPCVWTQSPGLAEPKSLHMVPNGNGL